LYYILHFSCELYLFHSLHPIGSGSTCLTSSRVKPYLQQAPSVGPTSQFFFCESHKPVVELSKQLAACKHVSTSYHWLCKKKKNRITGHEWLCWSLLICPDITPPHWTMYRW
jgi:hypothetical protein